MKPTLLVLRDPAECDLRVVREEQPAAALLEITEERGLLVDQELGIAVVAHRDREVDPGPAGHQVRREDHGPARHLDLGQQQARGVTGATVKPESFTERSGTVRCRELEAAAAGEEAREAGDERGAIARVRRDRALPGLGPDDVGRPGEHQLRGDAGLERRQRTAGVVEVEVREHHHVDVVGGDAVRREGLEEDVAVLDDTVPLAQGRLEERADAGLEQDHPVLVADHKAAAGQRNPVALVGWDPLLPHRLRSVPEHRAAVEALRIAEHRRQGPHVTCVLPHFTGVS